MNSQNASPAPPTAEPPSGRKPRADGVQSRRAILHAAAELATTLGLEGLSIGELARHIGMSKSGLFAHFKSKGELELATIETAVDIFERDVVVPARSSPDGLRRVWALAEGFLGHLERRVFPGGCFIATVSVQLAKRPGRARDRVMEAQGWWLTLFADALRQAVAAGELPADVDIDQLVFEVTAMLVRGNFAWVMTGDVRVLEQTRSGVRNVLDWAAGPGGRQGSRRRAGIGQGGKRSRAR
jgi:AcrR family transcriptional regulator